MPSVEHELLLQLFRNRIDLSGELLRACAGIAFDGRAELGSAELSQVVSTEYRADHVVVLRATDDRATAAIIVEVQLGIDPSKRRTWPVYITTLRARLDCPVVLMVLAPRENVARWARSPIETGHPGFTLEVIAVSYSTLPRITDESLARDKPELAVLSALAHPDADVIRPALDAIHQLAPEPGQLYFDWLVQTHPEVLTILEQQMNRYEYQSDFARKYVAQGREEGREQGLQAAVIEAARVKAPALTDDELAGVVALRDLTRLTELLRALVRASDEREVRAALASVQKQQESR